MVLTVIKLHLPLVDICGDCYKLTDRLPTGKNVVGRRNRKPKVNVVLKALLSQGDTGQCSRLRTLQRLNKFISPTPLYMLDYTFFIIIFSSK